MEHYLKKTKTAIEEIYKHYDVFVQQMQNFEPEYIESCINAIKHFLGKSLQVPFGKDVFINSFCYITIIFNIRAYVHSDVITTKSKEEPLTLLQIYSSVPCYSIFRIYRLLYLCILEINQQEIIEILNKINNTVFSADIKNAYNLYSNKKYIRNNIYNGIITYFYENFLKRTDNEKKNKTGVYYTPFPVVNFINSSLQKVLKNHFDTNLVANNFSYMEFAAGTGAFVINAVQSMKEEIWEKQDIGRVSTLYKTVIDNMLFLEIDYSTALTCLLQVLDYLFFLPEAMQDNSKHQDDILQHIHVIMRVVDTFRYNDDVNKDASSLNEEHNFQQEKKQVKKKVKKASKDLGLTLF